MLIYKSKTRITKLLGFITAIIAVGFLSVFFSADSSDKVFLILIVLIMLCISIMSWNYQCVVKIEPKKQIIEKSVKTKLWNKTVRYPFSDFDKVQILMGGGSTSPGGSRIMYIIHLEGRSKISIPRSSENLEIAAKKGQNIADILNKPFIKEPKIGFILDIFERLT